MVHNGNHAYWRDYAAARATSPKLWIDMADRFMADPQIAAHAAGFKFFLEQVEDTFLLRRIATQLGFTAIAEKYRSVAPDLYGNWVVRNSGSAMSQ